MPTKTCNKCGWVHPSTDRTRCIVCGELFTEGPCALCGKYVKLVKGKYCRQCYSKAFNTPATQAWRKKRRANRAATYSSWIDRIKAIPKTYPTLTDKQWLDACNYFGGCAICGKESIDARMYFISFADGGRYCDWNVIPACERCASQAKDQPNPFIRMETRTASYRLALDNIIKYLEVPLDRATTNNASVSEQDCSTPSGDE